jgi:hypothetical protein
MSQTIAREYAILDRTHRHDASHRARAIGRTLREPGPLHMPRGFDPAVLLDLPEPARRWLTHAIEPGTLMVDAIEIQMHGEINLGGWRQFTATEALVPEAGFVWAAHTRILGLPVRGFDSYAVGQGVMRWRLLGLVPLMSAEGYDVTRSAADRLAAESVLLPTSLVAATWRRGDDADSAMFLMHFGHRHSRGRATIRVAPDGALRSVVMQRWGRPFGRRYAEHGFEVTFSSEFLVDGIAVPDGMTAAWIAPDGRRREFFRAAIDTADLFLAGGRHDLDA